MKGVFCHFTLNTCFYYSNALDMFLHNVYPPEDHEGNTNTENQQGEAQRQSY
jgi:hypothetical protein